MTGHAKLDEHRQAMCVKLTEKHLPLRRDQTAHSHRHLLVVDSVQAPARQQSVQGSQSDNRLLIGALSDVLQEFIIALP